MTTARVYDRLGRLQSISSTPAAAGEVPISAAYQYNDAGQRIRCTLGDGTYWLYSYDALGQVTSGNRYMADGTPIAGQQFSYAYDDIGNRTQAGSGGDGDGANLRTESYTRNYLNQYSARSNHRYLEVAGTATSGGTVTVNGSTASRQGGRFRSEWSVAGTAAAWQNVDVSLSAGEVVPDRKLYLPPQSESYSHDLDGNMTGDGRWTYTWDGENRLVSASTTSAAYSAGVPGRKVEYTYDWMGRMIRRVGYSGNPTTPSWTLTDDTRFAYDGWLCRWESMTNSSAASKPWVSAVKPSTTVRSDYTGWVGMRIMTGESPVWVTRLGRWVLSGNSGSHTVKLVTASTGVDVSGGSVSVNTSGASTNRFLYADLASPIQLAANTAYYLVSLETNGGDKWYQNDTVVTPGPGLTVTHAAHGSGGSYWTSGTANNGYGPVSLVGVPTTEGRTQLWGLDLSGSEQGAGGVGGLLGTRTGTTATRFMGYDGNGNIVGIVNGGTGKTAATMVYSPFGELIAREGDAERDRYGFSTKWGDGDTGTCYYGYRFYSGGSGRWLSRDSLGEEGGINVYGYVGNSPEEYIDPLGLKIFVRAPGGLDSSQFEDHIVNAFQRLVGDCAQLQKEVIIRRNRVVGWELYATDERLECVCNPCWIWLKAALAPNISGRDLYINRGRVPNEAVQRDTDTYIDENLKIRIPTRTSGGGVVWAEVPFEVVLWHETIGHGYRGLGHPTGPSNSQGGNGQDPTILEENNARACLRRQGVLINDRVSTYWDWDE